MIASILPDRTDFALDDLNRLLQMSIDVRDIAVAIEGPLTISAPCCGRNY